MKKILFFILILFSFIGCEKEPEIYTGSKSDGRLSGVFSVSSNKKVYFSQGNLCARYEGGVDNPYFLYCFFFANQWETLYSSFGNAVIKTPYPNNLIEMEITPYDVTYIEEIEIREAVYSYWKSSGSSTEFYHRIWDKYFELYTDMFPWGIVGDDLAVARGSSSVKAGDVFTASSLNSINADWGNLRILNGGNTPGWWRTLSIYEWEYLMFERENAESLMGLGMIIEVDDWGDAIGVCGLILLPDNSIVKLNSSGKRFSDNVFTIEEWREIEAKGAVFLTAASSLGGGNFPSDQREGGIVSAKGDMFYEDEEPYPYSWDVGYTSGYYWSSTSVSDEYSYGTNRLDAHCVLFKELVGYKSSSADKINNWMPIRLVQDVE